MFSSRSAPDDTLPDRDSACVAIHPAWSVLGMAVRSAQDAACVRWLRDCATLAQIRHACARRRNSEPPCRPNNEPGMGAGLMVSGSG